MWSREKAILEAIDMLKCHSRDGVMLAEGYLEKQDVDLELFQQYKDVFIQSLRDKGNRELSRKKGELLEQLISELERMIDGGR